MKTGICTSEYYIDALCTVDYEKMHNHGYDCADYQRLADVNDVLYNVDEKEFERILLHEKENADKNGITFSQVHGPWPVKDITEEQRKLSMQYMKKAVRGTKILGCKYLVVHTVMPYGWKDENTQLALKINEEYFKELCAYALEYDVCICAENLPAPNHRLAYTKNLVNFINNLNLPNLFICLDTGHSNVCRENIKEVILLCGSLLKVFHIHDNDGRCDAHTIPYGGNIDWNGFKEGIKEIEFDGCISIEANVNRTCTGKMRENMLKFLNEIAKELGNL